MDFHGRQLDLWINITVFVFFLFFFVKTPPKKNCCEHSWKCSVMIVFMPLFPYDIVDTRIKRKEGRFWNVWFRVRARSLYSVWPHLFFIYFFFSGLRHTDLLPPPTYFLFFLKERPSNSWRHRLYPSSTIWFTKYKKKERSEKMFFIKRRSGSSAGNAERRDRQRSITVSGMHLKRPTGVYVFGTR